MEQLIIFGATGGIGKAVSKILAQNNYPLILSGTDKSALEQLKNELVQNFKISCSIFQLNFLDIEKQRHQLSRFLKDFQISGAIFAQGIMEEQEDYFQNPEKIFNLYQINVFGVISIIRLLIKDHIPIKNGFISVFSSVAGLRGRKKNYMYGSSKSALNCYLEGLRHQYGGSGMLIQTVLPGMVKTGMTRNLPQSKLMANPEKVAKDFYKGFQSKKQIVYTPGYWKLIMMVVKNIPNFIFSKLNF